MSRSRERAILGLVLVGGPLAFYLLIGRAQVQRLDALRETRLKVEAEYADPMPLEPLRHAERAALEDPAAPWRQRMPRVDSESARLRHYHWVVSEFQKASREAGAPVDGLRSSWDPIHASFSVPPALGGADAPGDPSLDAPELRVQGWVVEARYVGSTPLVFRALEASGGVSPLLEPVGLRWEMPPKGQLTTHLALRNLVLVP